MKKILFFSILLIFNLGYSDLQSKILSVISKSKDSNRKAATGGYIDGKWYAWYDNTFIGKEEVVAEKFHKFKSLEVEVVGINILIGKNFDNLDYMRKVFLKVSDFKLVDENGNIYTMNNYPNLKKEKFIPNIVSDGYYLHKYLYENNKDLKFIGSEKKDKNSKLIILDTVPTKLSFLSTNNEIICAETDGKTLHLSCEDAIKDYRLE